MTIQINILNRNIYEISTFDKLDYLQNDVLTTLYLHLTTLHLLKANDFKVFIYELKICANRNTIGLLIFVKIVKSLKFNFKDFDMIN